MPRRARSRSMADIGTSIESLGPRHPTVLLMVATLETSIAAYWHGQLRTPNNLVPTNGCQPPSVSRLVPAA